MVQQPYSAPQSGTTLVDGSDAADTGEFTPPHPGAPQMPRWGGAELIDAPRFTWRNWAAMIGPGLLMGGAAVGGGEWLLGPAVTARYGAGLLWLATLSIVGQLFYNTEICRYTLYTGEPIFTGKFRTLPGPGFWLFLYLLLDFGSLFPYLAANAATPLAAVMLGEIPDPGKHWIDLNLGFAEYGLTQSALIKALGFVVFFLCLIPLIFGGKIYNALKAVMAFKIVTVFGFLLFIAFFFSTWSTWFEILTGFVRFGTVPTGGDEVTNVFVSLARGEGMPTIDMSMIASLAAFAAIAGSGGLTNTPLSNYTRDQGWGMGHHVGAIPSVVGGRNISLSHVGKVFRITSESLAQWRRWRRHVLRDQLVIWAPACFIGVALPSMLSIQFLPRGTVANDWTAAGMTANGVSQHVGQQWGSAYGGAFWYLTLFCGFLVLAPSAASTIDGFIRRWVDVFWTSSARLRKWEDSRIRHLYFYVLTGYASFGVVMLALGNPGQLVKIAGNVANFALGFSCFHTLVVNHVLLPPALRPGWFVRTGLFLSGVYFLGLASLVAYKTLEELGLVGLGAVPGNSG